MLFARLGRFNSMFSVLSCFKPKKRLVSVTEIGHNFHYVVNKFDFAVFYLSKEKTRMTSLYENLPCQIDSDSNDICRR